MPIPDFIVDLRRSIGTAPLWLSGVTAVILRDDEVLLGRRSDNGRLAPISGIIEPGEEPAITAVREALEEANVHIEVERLAWVHTTPEITYPNGDRTAYLDLTFRCRYVSGDPYPADGEASEVFWYPLARLDELDDMPDDQKQRVRAAAADEVAARFEA
ncbi:NUDIX hydrolase [Agromyces sp. SYSU T00194]|uniref:NUDIX hydrolase n=1 Tax=Agromyces chitinivorans TaxID=3158560 RepID=UPI0033934BA5